jgi:hypothetical protein
MRPPLVAALCAACLTGCPRPPPTKVAPPPIVVPEGCRANLAGDYVHATDPTWLYRGRDDGGTLLLEVGRASAAAPDGGAVRIELTRTPRGFVGSTFGEAFNSAGQRCPIAVPTELTACDDGGITLHTFDRLELDARCEKNLERAQPVDERLNRLDGGPGR